MLSQRWNPFRVCSASNEICSAYAQCAMKFVPRMLSMDVHVKIVHILPLAEHAWKFVPRMLTVRWNRFLICSVCDKIVSTYAACACYNFRKLLKYTKLKFKFLLQILTINNRNFEKPSKNPSNRTKVKIVEKFFF